MQHSGTGTYSVQCPRVGYLWSEAVGQAPGRMGRKKKMQFGADQWEKSRRVTKRGTILKFFGMFLFKIMKQ